MSKPTIGPLPATYNAATGRVRLLSPQGDRVEVELSELAHRDAAGSTTYALRASKISAGWRFAEPDAPPSNDSAPAAEVAS